MKVLSVDDNAENLYLVELLLSAGGHEVVSVRGGIEALARLHAEPVDLVLSDVLMPEMDGFALCRAIKADPKLRHVPVVFYTATYTEDRDRQLALSLGAARYLIKPIEPREFEAVLREVLAEAQAGALTRALIELPAEDQYLRTYNERLVQKLEKKMLDLAAANRRLQAELAAHAETTAALLRAQKLQVIGQLAAGAVHEMNNLLVGVTGTAGLLRERVAGDPEALADLDLIAESARAASTIARQLLTLGRQGEVRRAPVDLEAHVASRLPMLQRATGPEIRVVHEQGGRPARIAGDLALLDQLLTNLAINARDAMAGGGTLRLRTACGAATEEGGAPRSVVTLSVQDTGPGLSEEIRAHLFEPFYTTKPEGRGSGLGLATVQRVVQVHEGRIRVESSAVGTTFTMEFPALDEPDRAREG
ncbi:MAG: response regulator [Deltaproteobacteria bacterium]|nr:response regulator [Deltaproteobacteria bacterium]